MSRQKLEKSQIESRLKTEIPQWHFDGESLKRQYKFENFLQAFGFMTKAALVSEKLDHHPNWRNVYNQVDIEMSTHDVGGVSEKDFEWIKAVDKT